MPNYCGAQETPLVNIAQIKPEVGYWVGECEREDYIAQLPPSDLVSTITVHVEAGQKREKW